VIASSDVEAEAESEAEAEAEAPENIPLLLSLCFKVAV
jgi:hypothetical protein